MKTHLLQAAFARKRETEHIRTERTEAVDRYYVHWGKQTSKYENWTAPEYYKQAEENLRKSQERKDKERKLNERRDKLRQLLEREKISFEEELASLQRRGRPKSRNLSTNIMEKMDHSFKAKQEDKRRLELEAKLYGRLRHNVDDSSLLYESKSNNQVLAKLNWLDKQIEDQVHREQEEKITQERTLKMQEEIRMTEEHYKKRQEICEKEIKEIRALQEKHVTELKEREQEAESLKSEASYLQTLIEHINSELMSLEHSEAHCYEKVPFSNNLRNVKMTIRKRSEAFRQRLESDIELLGRLNTICCEEPSINGFVEKLKKQLKAEMQNLSQIECMYESEAKVNLQKCEEVWYRLSYERRLDLMNLMNNLKTQLTSNLNENQTRQKDLIEIRAIHLSSIEKSNERLKLLSKEDEFSSPRAIVLETPRSTKDEPIKPSQKLSESFTNLNLDCLSGDGVDYASQPNTAKSMQNAALNSSQGPKFGRKKVAWM